MNDFIILLKAFITALILTVIIEEIVAVFFGMRKKYEFIIVLTVNTLTNPIMMLYYSIMRWRFPHFPASINLLIQIPGEIMVVIAEAWIYKKAGEKGKYSFKHPLMLSLAANAVSWITGLLLQNGGMI